MKTYWDLSEQERADLSGDEVEQFGDAELMVKGVLKVTAPKLEVAPSPPEPDLNVFAVANGHARADIVFTTAEAARAFLELKPMIRNSHYHEGEWIYYVDPVSADEWKISAERANSKGLVDLRKHEFLAAKGIKARNEKLTADYDAAVKAQQDALADMWSDWRECGLKASRMQKIAETFATYERTADGDKGVAFRFLRKVFTDEQLLAALEWGAIVVPRPFCAHGDRIDEIADAYPASDRLVQEAVAESF